MLLRRGENHGKGEYTCINCNADVIVNDEQELPYCPHCHAEEFIRQ